MRAEAFGTARRQSKLDRARELGMQNGWRIQSGSDVANLLHDQRFDIVLELAGGDYITSDLELLSSKGRLILVGHMAGSQANVNLLLVLSKRLRLIGTVLRSRPLEEKIIAIQTFAEEVVPLFAKRALKPSVDRVFEFHEIAMAHEYMESNSNAGKIVISIFN
jgi:NADPH:quinone reductase-like Zn-dependent oxidoreductase